MREEPKRLSYDAIAGLTGRDIILQLREYLIAYRVFASGTTSTGFESGHHNPYEFTVKYGLCFNLSKYTISVTDSLGSGIRLEMLLETALDAQIEIWLVDNPQTGDMDTDIAYPFGEDDFYNRHKASTQHECPKRLSFVSHAIELLLV